MIEIFPGLHVGAASDLLFADDGNGGVKPGWFIVSAARDPWHRDALGYTGRGAPKDDPEYLIAERESRLILNLIDGPDPAYVRDEIIVKACDAIDSALANGDKVLLHCNLGMSRAPTIALLWLRFHCEATRPFLRMLSFDQALEAMKERYPGYDPAGGMLGYARNLWETSE